MKQQKMAHSGMLISTLLSNGVRVNALHMKNLQENLHRERKNPKKTLVMSSYSRCGANLPTLRLTK